MYLCVWIHLEIDLNMNSELCMYVFEPIFDLPPPYERCHIYLDFTFLKRTYSKNFPERNSTLKKKPLAQKILLTPLNNKFVLKIWYSTSFTQKYPHIFLEKKTILRSIFSLFEESNRFITYKQRCVFLSSAHIYVCFHIITIGPFSFKGTFWDFCKYSFKRTLRFRNNLDSKDSLCFPKQRVCIKNLIFDPIHDIHAKKSANIFSNRFDAYIWNSIS